MTWSLSAFSGVACRQNSFRREREQRCRKIFSGEPPQWEAYPFHQFIHTVGALPCCDIGGCWRSRTSPLGDGDLKDNPESLCVDVVEALPHCMEMISSNDVIRRVETYFRGGVFEYLRPEQAAVARLFLSRSKALVPSDPFSSMPIKTSPVTAAARQT